MTYTQEASNHKAGGETYVNKEFELIKIAKSALAKYKQLEAELLLLNEALAEAKSKDKESTEPLNQEVEKLLTELVSEGLVKLKDLNLKSLHPLSP